MKAFENTDPAELVAEVKRLRGALTEALETIAAGSEMRRRFVARALRAEARIAELEDLLGRTVDGALAQGWDLVATWADLADALGNAHAEGSHVPPAPALGAPATPEEIAATKAEIRAVRRVAPDTSADALASPEEIAAIKRREDA